MPQEPCGRLAVVVYFGDHLQLPLVPATSSMLAFLDGTTNEHLVGSRIFRDEASVFEFFKCNRFIDQTLIDILKVMRTSGGEALSEQQWQALMNTQVGAS